MVKDKSLMKCSETKLLLTKVCQWRKFRKHFPNSMEKKYVLIFALCFTILLLFNSKFHGNYQFSEKYTTNFRTFWTSDLHDGSRIDVPSLLRHLGHRVIVAGVKGNRGPYPDVLRHFVIPGVASLSQAIRDHPLHTNYLMEEEIRENFEYFQYNELIQQTDAFICSFPASFCEIWMPFNKTIIFMPSHRFGLGRCTGNSFQRLIDHVLAMDRSKSPRHIIAAAGKYDAEYINYYTGLKPIVLSTSAFFYASHDIGEDKLKTQFTKQQIEILVGPLQWQKSKLEHIFKNLESSSSKFGGKWNFTTAKDKYGFYKLQNIADHRAVVMFPYSVLSFGMTEINALAVPILMPSIDFLIDLNITNDRTLTEDVYCGQQLFPTLPRKHPNSLHKYSPESKSTKALKYWLNFMDPYQWPHVTIFDSFDDLILKLENMDFDKIHQSMVEANRKREEQLLYQWKWIISQIDTNRKVPSNYDTALKELWNVTRLQVDISEAAIMNDI